MPSPQRALFVLCCLLLLAAGSLLMALLSGTLAVAWSDLAALLEGSTSLSGDVLLQLRLPRALGTFACGGLLALAGAIIQTLLRNPLGDPYVLGISGGASLAALLALLLGAGALWVNFSAFGGALGMMLLVFALAHGEGAWSQSRLLLTGVMLASASGAGISLILTIAPDHALHGMLFWIMGDAAHIQHPAYPLLLLMGGLLCSMPIARDLNVMARGELEAAALGVNVKRLRWLTYFMAALLTAGAVASAGSIGFVGLLVPHLMRLLLNNDQRLLLPAVALGGGILLTLADTLARTLFAPQQLPVGVITALIGVPAFLYLLHRQGRGT